MNTGVIFNIRYLLFNLLGLIAFCIRKVLFSLYHKLNKYNLIINKIAVCGRGITANIFFEEEYKMHDKVYLANYSKKDLNFIDYFKLLNKDIVIVANVSEEIPNILLFFFIKLTEVILSRPNYLAKRSKKDFSRKSFRLNLLGVRVRGLSNSTDINKYPCTLDNTGILSIYEAALFASKNNIKEIYLYGFEFYSNPYNKNSLLKNDFISTAQYEEHQADNFRLSNNLDYLASLFPNILFVDKSFNPYRFNSKNIKSRCYEQ